jgi:hypothetical protein
LLFFPISSFASTFCCSTFPSLLQSHPFFHELMSITCKS